MMICSKSVMKVIMSLAKLSWDALELRIHTVNGATHFIEKDMARESITRVDSGKASGSCLVTEMVKSTREAGNHFSLHLLMLAWKVTPG